MKQFRVIVFFLTFIPLLCFAQNSKKVRALKAQKTELQKTLKKSQNELDKTKKQVKTGQKNIQYLGHQLDNRLEHIRNMETEMNQLDSQMVVLQSDIFRIDSQLAQEKAKLKQVVRYARANRQQTSPLVFILSARTFTQMYRRARYANEFASYQKNLGEQVFKKQTELLEAQNKLLNSKSKMNNLLREVMSQRKQLNIQQIAERKNVDGLKKKESGLANTIAQQQKQLAALDKKIDALIAYEIEQARKKAEEEARKKAAEEAARKAKTKKGSGSKTDTSSKTGKSPSTTSGKSSSGSWLTAKDKQLNGTFAQNKGRLPVPITGQYMLGNRFGLYNVPGLKNVQLDNKGTNYIGKPGARARCIFDGEVTAVFQFSGTKNVLVRHGSYISVYCNLSSVIVSKGQQVHAKDILGTVADDGSGNCVLHFQLRKETAKLNPEAWIGK